MTTYTVKAGDSLSKIAQRFYGNALKYPAIAMANHIAAPYIIHPGQVLTIPNAAATPAPVASPTLSPFIARPAWMTSSGQAGTASVPTTFAQTFPPIPSAPATPPAARRAPGGAKAMPAPSGGFLHSLMANKKLLIGGAAVLAIAAVAGGSRRGK